MDNLNVSADLPKITSADVCNITQSTVQSGGIVISNGKKKVLKRGVCWSILTSPTINDNLSFDGEGTGVYLSLITGLTPNTTYYLRAYATNEIGTSYGEEKSFTTNDSVGIPSVTTSVVYNITQKTAESGGNISNDGGSSVTARGVCWSTLDNPLINERKTSDGTGAGPFISLITGLYANTTYHIRAYAINPHGIAYGEKKSFTTITNTIHDVEGNVYPAVLIGSQLWMAENLKTTHYDNGDVIPNGSGVGDISGEYEPKYWFVYDDDIKNEYIYGKLYTWYTVTDRRNLCPAGWHVPDNAEWITLINYLGEKIAGGKMKETGTMHWLPDNTGANNESGFSGLPGGTRFNEVFDYIRIQGGWWSSTEEEVTRAWIWHLGFHLSIVQRKNHSKYYGYSVRCVKD